MNKSTAIFLSILLGLLVLAGIAFLTFWLILKNSSKREEIVFEGTGDNIAVVDLKGIILESEEVVRQLKNFDDDHSVVAIILRVDSPGGAVVPSQEIYEEVKNIKKSGKIIVVSMGSLAASGGYYASCGATRIVCNKGTLTGSIGVISEFMQFDSLMKKIGVKMNVIKSGKLKDAGSPYRDMTELDREYYQSLMDNVHKQFIKAVESERKISHDTLTMYADGRVFTGEQALKLGLVDTLGTFEDAVRIASDLAGIRGKPSIIREAKKKTSLLDLVTTDAKIDELLDFKNQILNHPILQYKIPQGF